MRMFFFLLLLLPRLVCAADFTLMLHPVRLPDLARVVYGDLLKTNFLLQPEFVGDINEVSINWQHLPAAEVEKQTAALIRSRGYEIQKSGGVLNVRKSSNYDDEMLIYAVKNRSSKYLSEMIAKVVNVQSMGSKGLPAPAAALTVAPDSAGAASNNFSSAALDQLVFSCKAVDCIMLRRLLEQLDTPELNVALRAVVYEVATSKNEGSAVQIAERLLQGVNGVGFAAGSVVAGAPALTFQLGNFSAILSILDTDSRFKSLARPFLRVKSGGTAKFSVGSQVPILGAISMDKNGAVIQSVEYRPAGTIFTVTPDIRGDVVDLNLTQELSSFVVTTSGVNNSPTILQRTASSTLSLHDKEIIVFAGLEESKEDEAKESLFGFLLSKKSSGSRSEILLFIEAQKI